MAESDLQRRRPGPRDSGLPPQRSAPCRRSWVGSCLPERTPAAHQRADTSCFPCRVSEASSAGLQRRRAAWGPRSHPGRPPLRTPQRLRARPLPAWSPDSRHRPASLPVTPRAALPREGPGGLLASGAGQTGWAALPGRTSLVTALAPPSRALHGSRLALGPCPHTPSPPPLQ